MAVMAVKVTCEPSEMNPLNCKALITGFSFKKDLIPFAVSAAFGDRTSMESPLV